MLQAGQMGNLDLNASSVEAASGAHPMGRRFFPWELSGQRNMLNILNSAERLGHLFLTSFVDMIGSAQAGIFLCI
jgi:hypothetical protein